MKKLLSTLLCAAVLLTFAGCSTQKTTPTADPTSPTAEPTVQPTAEPSADPATDPSSDPAADPALEPNGSPEAVPGAETPVYTIEYDTAVFALTAKDSTDTYAPVDGSSDAVLTVQYLAAEEVEAYTAEHLGDGAEETKLGAGEYTAAASSNESGDTKTDVYLINLSDGSALALTVQSVGGAHAEALEAMLASFTLN